MFVLKSSLEEAERERRIYKIAHGELLKKYNVLVNKINAKGGQEFLDSTIQEQVSSRELNQLLRLCHPDKHKGNTMANELTKKLLQLRKGT